MRTADEAAKAGVQVDVRQYVAAWPPGPISTPSPHYTGADPGVVGASRAASLDPRNSRVAEYM